MSKRRVLSGPQFKDRPTPEQRQAADRYRRQQDADARLKSDGLLFWKVCRNKRCRRHNACSGRDPEACWRTKWPQLPEDFRETVRLVVQFRHNGMAPMEAVRAAQAELARLKALEAAWAAKAASVRAPTAGSADDGPLGTIAPPTPRVRLT